MNKIRVMTVVGTRPEIIRLSRVMAKLDVGANHTLVHTGQNYDYELNEIFFHDMKLRKPDYCLDSAGKTLAETIGKIMFNIEPIIDKERPEAFLVLGDTNSTLSAIVAKRKGIPVFHMEAGNRCFDQRVPEEINRKIVDHVSDVNMPYSSIAREYLLREGLSPDCVIKTGSPMFEVLNYYRTAINNSQVLGELGLSRGEYFLVSAHREENIESDVNFKKFIDLLNMLSERHSKRVILSTHPRTRKRIDMFNSSLNRNIETLKPLGFLDYVFLEINSFVTLSDSGTITEESSILNFPALNIRETHERPEGMEEASVIMTGLDIERVEQGIGVLKDQDFGMARTMRLAEDYNVPNVSEKILRIILSYTDYAKRKVWKT